MQNQSSADAKRVKRGIALANAGAAVKHGDLYVVAGTRNYTVSLPQDGEPRCDCPDFAKRRQTCKHGYAVVVFASRRACRRRKTAAKPKTDRRHKGDSLKGILTDLGRLDRTAARMGV